jgi:hypothetical protein
MGDLCCDVVKGKRGYKTDHRIRESAGHGNEIRVTERGVVCEAIEASAQSFENPCIPEGIQGS